MDRENNVEFIQGMLKAIASIYKDVNKAFSDKVYALATDPNVDFVKLRDKFNQACKDYGIPMSEGIKKFQGHMNQAIQKEEDLKIAEDNNVIQEIREEQEEKAEEVLIAENAEQLQEEVNTEEVEQLEPTSEVIEEKAETIGEENVNIDYSNEEVSLSVGPDDNVESIGNQLLDLKSKGILATAVIGGVVLSNANFDKITEIKSDYYYMQAQSLKNAYQTMMENKDANDHIEMAVVTPKGEDNKRRVMISNPNNTGANRYLEFSDGKDFDLYLMPTLIDSFIGENDSIKEVDDELGTTRGRSFSSNEEKDNDSRYLYVAEMSNGNKLTLSMTEESIDNTKSYINERLQIVTKEVNKEANQVIEDVIKNTEDLEKADKMVKQLKFNPPSSNGFISGLGIGALVGLSVIGNIVVLYLLKIFG